MIKIHCINLNTDNTDMPPKNIRLFSVWSQSGHQFGEQAHMPAVPDVDFLKVRRHPKHLRRRDAHLIKAFRPEPKMRTSVQVYEMNVYARDHYETGYPATIMLLNMGQGICQLSKSTDCNHAKVRA